MPTWDDRTPFLSSAGRAQLQKRVAACAPSIAQGFDLPESWLTDAKLLGCGNYGCSYLLAERPPERGVLKATADNLEAHTVALLGSWGERKPDGIVQFGRIRKLGKCSVLPRMRWPHRTIWIMEREELPDVMPVLKQRGVKKSELTSFLYLVHRWAKDLAANYIGNRREFQRFYTPADRQQTYARLFEDDGTPTEATTRFGAAELLHSIEWLLERQIAFFDFVKIANLGWREGTGLVIRDIGYSSTDQDMEDEDRPAQLDGLRLPSRCGGVLYAPESTGRLAGGWF